MNIEWIKISVDMFSNRKIKQIKNLPNGDTFICIWFELLCLAGALNSGGLLYLTSNEPYTVETLAIEFGRAEFIIEEAINAFLSFEMLEVLNGAYYLPNWEKYQNIEQMEKIREQNRLRKQRQRENEKTMSRDCHGTVTGLSRQCHATDKDKDKDKDNKDIGGKSTRFVPPTLEEVKSYISEKGYSVDAERFINFYESKGWYVGKNKMKDWKAAVRTWQKDDKEKPSFKSFGERNYTNEELEQLEADILSN